MTRKRGRPDGFKAKGHLTMGKSAKTNNRIIRKKFSVSFGGKYSLDKIAIYGIGLTTF